MKNNRTIAEQGLGGNTRLSSYKEGCIGMVPHISTGSYYSSGRREIAKAMKLGNTDAIRLAAVAIATAVKFSKDAILVPVPSHLGYATYTLELANEIARLTGSEVADVLKGAQRDMLYDIKKRHKPVSVEYLGVYATKELPQDRPIYYVDNVVATGATAKAVFRTFGRGTMLTYAHAIRHGC